ncbi:uncharacterized protein V1516DRAFT_636463 [Lipomyces oligophaga]|uniref:uncharacterized protein n=1 Tax=Lipomyces oligophaga TaxID=45792 RepID=UPI0034CD20AC
MSETEEPIAFEIKKFGLEPLVDPPTTDSAINLVQDIISTVPKEWKVSKASNDAYSSTVYWKYIDGELWYLRTSVHDLSENEELYDWFKKTLYEDHFNHMVNYYDVVKEVNFATTKGDWDGYNLSYSLPAPFADRAIATWLMTHTPEDADDETFYVVATPADIPLPSDAVTRGVYSFFHRVRKTEDNKIEWVMGQTSDMRGNLPRWVQNMSIPGILVSDVDDFMKWLQKNYGSSEEAEADVDVEDVSKPSEADTEA